MGPLTHQSCKNSPGPEEKAALRLCDAAVATTYSCVAIICVCLLGHKAGSKLAHPAIP